jgi:hypothetical protein
MMGAMTRTPRTPSVLPVRPAALALAALVLTACGGTADEPSAQPTEKPSATASEPTGSAEPSPDDTTQPPKDEAVAVAPVKVKGDSVTPVAQSVQAKVGQTITFEISSDRAGELHVHSTPEQFREFGPGRTTVELSFDKPGAVDVEEHESDALVLRVLVR